MGICHISLFKNLYIAVKTQNINKAFCGLKADLLGSPILKAVLI